MGQHPRQECNTHFLHATASQGYSQGSARCVRHIACILPWNLPTRQTCILQHGLQCRRARQRLKGLGMDTCSPCASAPAVSRDEFDLEPGLERSKGAASLVLAPAQPDEGSFLFVLEVFQLNHRTPCLKQQPADMADM